ncbi:MAG: tetratricopeptide repeat protein [Pseudomonadota bacterium]
MRKTKTIRHQLIDLKMLLLLLCLAGCDEALLGSNIEQRVAATPHAEKSEPKINVSDAMLTAKESFRSGNYGNAEQLFRRIVEENPQNADAWLGLAATYDRLKRFENANRAYMYARKLVGYTPRMLNNLGYHYILRNEYSKARKLLLAAQRKEPDNPRIQNNLGLLLKKEEQKTQSLQTNVKSF